jgi:hypothetical protein
MRLKTKLLIALAFITLLVVVYVSVDVIQPFVGDYCDIHTPAILPIDAVLTWLDPNDPAWKKSREEHGGEVKVNDPRLPQATFPVYELETAVILIRKHAPWIGTIFIVCPAGQRPKFIDQCLTGVVTDGYDRVKVINQDDIVPKGMEDSAPVFNSHAVEANIHRIPGLAERFLYFCDDMYLTRYLDPDDCFTGNSMIVQPMKRNKQIIGFGAHANVWKRMMNDYRPLNKIWHGFLTLTKTAMIEAEKEYKDEWDKTIYSRFRDSGDIAPLGLTVNYALKNNMACLAKSPLKLEMFTKNEIFDKDVSIYDMVCINGSQDTERSVSNLRESLLKSPAGVSYYL